MWWALIEEIAPRAEEMAGEKEIACCVRGHVYLDIWAAAIRKVLVCSTELTNVGGKIFVVKFIRVKYFRTFSSVCVRKYFYDENKANYGTKVFISQSC